MKGHEFSAGNVEIERKLLRGSNRSTTDCFPFLDDGAQSMRQILEMSRIPAILGYPAVRKRRPEHSRQTEKQDCNRRNALHCTRYASKD